MSTEIKENVPVITREERRSLALRAFQAKKKIMEIGYFRAIWCANYPDMSSKKDITYVNNVCQGHRLDVDIVEKLEQIVKRYER